LLACAQATALLAETVTLGCIGIGRCIGSDRGNRNMQTANRQRESWRHVDWNNWSYLGTEPGGQVMHQLSGAAGSICNVHDSVARRSSKLPPDGSFSLRELCLGAWQDISQQVVDVQATVLTFLPLPRVPQTHLFESCVVYPVCSPDVQVSTDDYLCVVFVVPIFCLLRATPQAKTRHPE
jgi:hypothetical protein